MEQLSGLKTDRVEEFIEISDEFAIEPVEWRGFFVRDGAVVFEGFENATGQGGIDLFEQLQEDNADPIPGSS